MPAALSPWSSEHFIGGHPALDLANAVFDRRTPADDNELLKSTQDLANWFRACGLANDREAHTILEYEDGDVMVQVRAIREASFAVFASIASGGSPASEPLGVLMTAAATGLHAGVTVTHGGRIELPLAGWRAPSAVIGLLAMSAVHAYFTLPPERVRSCPRCGWLFVDSSKGGQRRWCSMRTCGNREKASRHRGQA